MFMIYINFFEQNTRPIIFYNFPVTFIGLQVLGSISLLSGNDSPVVSESKSSENKNVGANVDNHVNLKKLKNDKVNNVFGQGNLKYLYLHNKYVNY